MAKQQCFCKVTFTFQILKQYCLKKKNKTNPKLVRIQFSRYFQAEETTAIANIQIEEKQKAMTRVLNNLENLYLKQNKLAPTEEQWKIIYKTNPP